MIPSALKKKMILVFDSVSPSGEIILLDNNAHEVTRTAFALNKSSRKYGDILGEISLLLQREAVIPESISHIIFVNGPGRFTAIRTACIVANAFANFGNALLLPLSAEEYRSSADNIAETFVTYALRVTRYTAPVFDMEPNISLHKKSF